MKSQIAILGFAAHATAMSLPLVDRGSNIVGGQDAKIEDFPYQANFYAKGQPNCGGTILDKRTILTASHCTEGLKASDMTIYVGSEKLKGGTPYQVASFAMHPKYNTTTLDYDVAILKLAKDIAFTPAVKPIGAVGGVEPATGANTTVSGWGYLNDDGKETDTLQFVSVPIIDRGTCAKNYKDNVVNDRMICAGFAEGGKDSCNGDSGGPLVQGSAVVGIVSWGLGCARPNQPGVYTNVANKEIRDFIVQRGGL